MVYSIIRLSNCLIALNKGIIYDWLLIDKFLGLQLICPGSYELRALTILFWQVNFLDIIYYSCKQIFLVIIYYSSKYFIIYNSFLSGFLSIHAGVVHSPFCGKSFCFGSFIEGNGQQTCCFCSNLMHR